ncbi:lipid II:glycine glycyltransferase FemX [Nocardioides daejeonensis]|uniref:lipid II:glycine glycyltransferase FemX n=1 Tax=Nocardioides daejeonensis TaxID=1046556 RepID=UPI001EF58769|nr:peptidoglycan bridge formation glycyltransferase FemA/FemB family protein [Nocardioides daejeonensis]
MSSPTTAAPLTVRTATTAEHEAFLRTRRSASFLQTPAWASVKSEWRSESLLWERDGATVGAALVLYRQLPKVKRYLAYLPEGPVLDWAADDLASWLDPMVRHLKRRGAFAVRMGPPVITGRWSAAQVKAGIADESVRRLTELPPTERSVEGARAVSQLNALGWRHLVAEGGFAAGQPQYNFVIPLRVSTSSTTGDNPTPGDNPPTGDSPTPGDSPTSGDSRPRSADEVLKGMNQLWRRNIKKAEKSGVVVTVGGADDLAAFHRLYVHTAERDHFTPRPLSYFQTMYAALNGAGDLSELRLYLAHHEGDLVASTLWIRVGGHAWYSYGASSTEKREVRGSNAVQWRMIVDALEAGADVYDLRGITDTLDADDAHVGLIQFKVGTGGEAVEYAGEWDLPINRALYKAFTLYMERR